MGKSKSQKSATDLLSEINDNINLLLQYYINIDNNLKLLLQSSNKPSSTPSISLPEEQPTQIESYQTESSQIEKTTPNSKNVVQGEAIEDDEESTQLEQEAIPKGSRRVNRTQENADQPSKRIAVTQKISFPDGEAIAWAKVEVLDQSGQVVKKTTTSGTGAWLAPLTPGKYVVYIRKPMSEDGSRLPVEIEQNIVVPDTNKSVNLPSPELPQAYLKEE